MAMFFRGARIVIIAKGLLLESSDFGLTVDTSSWPVSVYRIMSVPDG